MKLSIIIVNYNNPHLIEKCLSTILASSISFPYEIIIVDNASTALPKIPKSDKTDIHILRNKENVGFGRANNQAVSIAKGEFLLFLNTDTEVLDNAVDRLVSFAEDKTEAIVGAKLFNPNGTAQPSCGPFYTLPVTFMMLFMKGDQIGVTRYSPNKVVETDWVSGACLLVRKEDFEKVGRFDSSIFMYMDEIDFCFRAKKAGMRVLFYPQAHFVHIGAATSRDKRDPISNIYLGLMDFYKKHGNYVQYKVVKSMLWAKAVVGIVVGKSIHNASIVSAYQKAISYL
jgi:GT2 family glycosyltransferase